ncbi:MAG: carbonic anhydrase [Clostridium sp.]|nr:carbonic anhydrase [Clostridium sp.]
MNKKIPALLLLLTLTLTGCGESTNTNTNNNSEYKTEDIQITDADAALARLKEGNDRFVNNNSELINVTSERRDQLLEGQNPYATIVSCSDSRVTPTTIFDAGLGEIFDIRIAGNVVDDDALGSIEYAVDHLHTPLIVVMGHEKCGAVTAAYDKLKNNTPVEGKINSLVDKILPSISDSDSLNDAINENAEAVADVVEHDEIISKYEDEGKVKIVKAYYSLDGKVTFD